ncbi:MAG TPA: hypothetical protein ENK54_09645 [Thiotrichales bacterium]|nr:hypothetical protein [Thiotrichales bacterium]
MKREFQLLAEQLFSHLGKEEVLLLSLYGEESDFVRINHARIRQAGTVHQTELKLTLIDGRRQASLRMDGSSPSTMVEEARQALHLLRDDLHALPEDPWLTWSTAVRCSQGESPATLPDGRQMAKEFLVRARGLDLVGILASGSQSHGFANSLGQFNWHSGATFHLDWSCHLAGSRAVKESLAGSTWNADRLTERLEGCHRLLEVISRPPLRIPRGRHRAWLAPAAVAELTAMMNWGGFGIKALRTGHSPLRAMVEEGYRLDPRVTLREDHRRGIAPPFDELGFLFPQPVTLIEAGTWHEPLVSPRSAREYGVDANSGEEIPLALEMAGGELDPDEAARLVDTGLILSNLWYCNFSDRNRCRITGMTRYACLWVEKGKPVAPIEPMRFDDSVYHLLGDRLEGLSRQRLLLRDADTYDRRSTASQLLPALLVSGIDLTL